MNIWHAPQRVADYVNIAGYAGIVVGTMAGLAGYLLTDTLYAVALLIASPLLIAGGTLATFWASGIRSIHTDRTISIANANAEEARLASLQAQAALEREKRARIRLEQALQHRRLSPLAVERLVEGLRECSTAEGMVGAISAAVFAINQTLEAQNLVEQIAEAFARAGFRVSRRPAMHGAQYALIGVGVLTSDTAEATRRGESIIGALTVAGLATVKIPPRRAHNPEQDKMREYHLGVSIAVGDRL